MIDKEWLDLRRSEWSKEPVTAEDINVYRTNYDVIGWHGTAERDNTSFVVPVGATLAIERLCCEVERLQEQVKAARVQGMKAALDLVEDFTTTISVHVSKQ